MTQLRPSPRQAVFAFIGFMSGTITTALGGFISGGGTTWDAEDSIYALRDMPAANREGWVALEAALASRQDPGAALTLVEGMAAAATQGQPANPTQGTEADVVAIWDAHLSTSPERRERLRALSRVVSSRESPTAVLAALAAAVAALPAAE